MRRLAYFALLLALLLASGSAVQAQGVTVQSTDPTWQVRYWNNPTLSGSPALMRQEGDPNYAATAGSFAPALNADGFSARWEKYVDVPAGSYRFRVTADDGVRLSVDGKLLLDKWVDQAAASDTVDVTLSEGYHYVVLDYYENKGSAQLQLAWGPASTLPTPGPWKAEFWSNGTLSGSPAAVTTVSDVAFAWGNGAPVAGVPADGFSARFSRTVRFEAGNYRFSATADDGVRLFVAGRLLIDQWRVQAPKSFTYDIYLPAGDSELRVEYFEATGGAQLKLGWAAVGAAQPPAPSGEVIVEDGSSGFVTGGSTTGFRSATEGSGGRLTWTRNNRSQQPNYNWARWYPTLKAGRYELFVFIPQRYTTTTHATYWVAHQGGYTSVRVNQSAHGGQWLSLGSYTFRGTNADYLSLNDITGEAALSTLIAFDAAKWVPK